MCSTCGCSHSGDPITITHAKGEEHSHHHPHSHSHPHSHDSGTTPHTHLHVDQTLIELEQDILSKNDLAAARNRGYLEAKEILALNLVSSPGSGKTSLLETTLHDMKGELAFAVIEGDQQSMQDANRIAASGCPAVQINTGKACHLDANMVYAAMRELNPPCQSVLMIENVGNLVCPSMFDLGENKRVVIISVTEGEDKPLKYPDMFYSSQLCLINKTDLLPYVDFDVERAKAYALEVNPELEFIEVSATKGTGMESWYQWLRTSVQSQFIEKTKSVSE